MPLTTCEPWNSAFDRFASGVSLGEVTRALLGGVALSGQRGFVHEEVGGTEDAAVGRDGRARREDDHVPRHESVLRQLDLVAVAQHPHPSSG